jgi:hypothetical protein
MPQAVPLPVCIVCDLIVMVWVGLFVSSCVSACKFAFVQMHTAKSGHAHMRVCVTSSPVRAQPATRLPVQSLDHVLSAGWLPPMDVQYVYVYVYTGMCVHVLVCA